MIAIYKHIEDFLFDERAWTICINYQKLGLKKLSEAPERIIITGKKKVISFVKTSQLATSVHYKPEDIVLSHPEYDNLLLLVRTW